MQNELDDGTILFNEITTASGFVIREMLRTKNPKMLYQAGHHTSRPMRIPVYKSQFVGNTVVRHEESESIQVFHLEGYGRTMESALDHAANNLLRAEIARSAKRQAALA